jgi:hypothetical protein
MRVKGREKEEKKKKNKDRRRDLETEEHAGRPYANQTRSNGAERANKIQ